MSHVEFKKKPCRPVGFEDQGPVVRQSHSGVTIAWRLLDDQHTTDWQTVLNGTFKVYLGILGSHEMKMLFKISPAVRPAVLAIPFSSR